MVALFVRASAGSFGQRVLVVAAASITASIAFIFAAPFAWAKVAPPLRSNVALVIDDESGKVLMAKNAEAIQPIASITKLITAMVVFDARQDLEERIEILEDDKSKVKFTRSRLRIGSVVSRDDLLRLALMASDNRAALALARAFPGGADAAIAAMNRKAATLGLSHTRFVDPAGLSSDNTSNAADLVRLVRAARSYRQVASYSTLKQHTVQTKFGPITFGNTNSLVRGERWQIDLSKTGFIAEAGRCLVMRARMAERPVTLVLLDAAGKFTSFGDAHRIRQWLEPSYTAPHNAVADKKRKSREPVAASK